jgi:hypothetical protein
VLHFFIGSYSVIISALYFFLPLYLRDALNFSGAQIGLLYGVLSLALLPVAYMGLKV